MSELKPDEDKIDKPPFFNSWCGMYWLVLAGLAFQILVFYFLTQYYK